MMGQERCKKIVILCSSDMLGDLLVEAQGSEGKLIGGLSLLSGYISRVVIRVMQVDVK
jgi:5'-nucleotidase